jgi:pseudaminic acid synthase
MTAEIEIAGRKIGANHPPYVICELSGNHNGDLQRALAMIDAAAATGCDAIKLQTYTPDTITLDCDGPGFRIEDGPWAGRTLHQLYAEAYTPFEWHEAIFARARQRDVTLFSTPFDETAVELLESLGAPAYKIASFEAVDLPLIARVAACRKPMIISTGLASLEEMAEAVETAKACGAAGVALLHCVSAYPAPMGEANVRTVPDLARRFGVVTGLSDHTPGSAAAVAAVALGAALIEKHFTLARADGGPDAAFSLEPAEFSAMTADCKAAWEALGSATYDELGSERAAAGHRRSLYVAQPVKCGETLTAKNVRSVRPGYGLAPKHLTKVLGRKAARDLKFGEPLDWSMVV